MPRAAVIMAGGPGTRLWPMSRKSRPKQLLPFGPGGKSLLRVSLERLLGPFERRNIYVIAGAEQLPAVREELPELPPENLIGEPSAKDTANAIGLACAILAERYPTATVGVFTADHIIEPIDQFQAAVKAAMAEIEYRPDYLGTFGIKPTWAHLGLGYIQRGEEFAEKPMPVFSVRSFTEKPDARTAQDYLDCGQYYWNSGMFIWKATTIIQYLKTFLPANAELLMQLATYFGTPDWPQQAAKTYDQLEKVSIDYAVMENAEKVLVVELPCRWADVGNWSELKNVAKTDAAGNTTLAERLLTLASNDNILVSSDNNHLLATIGVKDLIVVHTPDATLICSKDQAQRIKELVGRIEDEFFGSYI